jgi:cell division protein FtsB
MIDEFEEYEEYFGDPSAADSVILKAKSDLFGLLTDEARDLLEKVSKANEELESLQSDIVHARYELQSIEADQVRERKKLDELKNGWLPKELVQRFVHDATGGFAPGDTVYTIKPTVRQKECPLCAGSKNVSASIHGQIFDIKCPECSGYGRKSEYTYSVDERRVAEVRLKLCFEERRINRWSSDVVYLTGNDYSTNPKELYRSREEAEAALKGEADGKDT